MITPDLFAARWRKSSRSTAQGGNCVEIASVRAWRKSSRSSGQGGQCVEVAGLSAVVAVRDSKDPDGPALGFSRPAFGTLMRQVKAGRYGL